MQLVLRTSGGKNQYTEDHRAGLIVLPAANEPLSMLHVEIVCILVIGVFCVDLFVPLGSGISFFYVVPVAFLALWSSPKQSLIVMGVAAGSSILIGVGFALSPPGDFWYAVTNRSYAVIVIGAIVLLSVVRKRAGEQVKALQGLLLICCYCKKIRDDKGYWQQWSGISQNDLRRTLVTACVPTAEPNISRTSLLNHHERHQ